MYRCDECGLEYDLDEASRAAESITDGVAELCALLGGDDDLRTRREPETWSPLEYGCHMRDVLLVQRERVLAARRVNTPSFEPMGRDERVDHDGYSEQHPDDVRRQLTDAAAMFINDLRRIPADEWDRTVVYNYPAVKERSVRWVAIHTVHEVRHHVLDVRRQLGGA
jgi:hypothetical protein